VGHFRRKKPITNAFNHAFAKSLLRLGLHLLRTKVILSGEENIPKGKFVLVSNHQENYDILVIMTAFKNHPLSFVAKEVLGKLPIFGKWMQILGNVFISRDADRQAAMAMIQAIKNYNQGLCMAIFPEGKRSFFNQMLPFKPGAFKLAMKPKADIVIATQYNTCTILKKIPWKPYKVYLHIHEVIPYEFYKNMTSHELSEFVKQKIQKQIDIFDKQLQ
jgi:1-acyl-sn-glycerol-3-phosphate acyltransferase